MQTIINLMVSILKIKYTHECEKFDIVFITNIYLTSSSSLYL